MVDLFSKPVVATFLFALSMGAFGTAIYLYKTEHKGKSDASSVSSSASSSSSKPKILLTSTKFDSSVNKHLEHSGKFLAVLSRPVSVVYTSNPPNEKHTLNEIHESKLQYEVHIVKNSQTSKIEFLCPTSMKPNAPLALYTPHSMVPKKINDIYIQNLADTLTKHQSVLDILFASENETPELIDLAPSVDSTTSTLSPDVKDALHEVLSRGCPQLAPRPFPVPVSIPQYDSSKYRCNHNLASSPTGPHIVALFQDVYDTNDARNGFKDYPSRTPVTEYSWKHPVSDYSPKYYMNDVQITKFWAEPFTPPLRLGETPSNAELVNLLGNEPRVGAFDVTDALTPVDTDQLLQPGVFFDAQGFPWNPCGRTGLVGRGLLGRWGPNDAVDPLVTRSVEDVNNPGRFIVEVLLITRPEPVNSRDLKEGKRLAIPGGMTDFITYDKMKHNQEAEAQENTAFRELAEETGMVQNFKDHPTVRMLYQGYSDDPRNTDNAWMQTRVLWKHLPFIGLYARKSELQKHRRPVVMLNSMTTELKEVMKKGVEEMKKYLSATVEGAVDSQMTAAEEEKVSKCLRLNKMKGVSCVEKLRSVVGEEVFQDEANYLTEAENLAKQWVLIKMYINENMVEISSIEGWPEAVEQLRREATGINEEELTMNVLLDALAYITKKFEAEDKTEVEGQAWVSLEKVAGLPDKHFFAMHAYFVKRVWNYVQKQQPEFHAPQAGLLEQQV